MDIPLDDDEFKIVLPKKRLGLSRNRNAQSVTITPNVIVPITNSLEVRCYHQFKHEVDDSTRIFFLLYNQTIDTNSSNSDDCSGTVSECSDSQKIRAPPKPIRAKYKLTLCQATEEKMTRKRKMCQDARQAKRIKLESNLEYDPSAAESFEKSGKFDEIENSEKCDNYKPIENSEEIGNFVAKPLNGEILPCTESLLQHEIEELKSKIAKNEEHEQRIVQLQKLISKWREAGRRTIDELQQKFTSMEGTTVEVNAILAHYQIDTGVFDFEFSE